MRLATALVAVLVVSGSNQALAEPSYRGGAVATANPHSTRAALAMLEAGGNAIDAAVAAAFTIGVSGPYHTSLGGGGFLVAYDAASGKTQVLDFREVAPKAAARDMYLRDGKPVPELSRDGALSVAVPAAAAGLLEAHRSLGRLPRSQVLGPATRVARTGFWVGPLYRSYAELRLECLRASPDAARIFLRATLEGEWNVPPVGTVIRQPELAATLQALATRGPDGFYKGKVAEAIVSVVRKGGGVLTLEDLTSYRPQWRAPLEGFYRGHRIVTMPPPSAGGVILLQTLGVLERAFPNGFVFHDPEALHVASEAERRAFAERARVMGDPAFVKVSLPDLLASSHLDTWAQDIDRARATPSASLNAPAEASDADKHTTHISVVDRQGNAASVTITHNYLFGSCVVAPGTGVLLNDEMDDFAAAPNVPNTYGAVSGEVNTVAPGKIPLSSMTPTLVFQKDKPQSVFLVVGSPGGSTIPSSVLHVVSSIIDGHLDNTRAIAATRFHHQFLPDELWVEDGADPATVAALKAKGHVIRPTRAIGSISLVRIDPTTGLRTATTDPRGDGVAAGQE